MKEKLGELLGDALVVVVYVTVGFAMSLVYTFLAGWDVEYLATNAMFLPFVTLLILGFYKACKDMRRDIPWYAHRIFFGSLGYCLLPIFTNVISIVLKWVGLTTTGSFIFEHRYTSLGAVPLTVIIGLMAYSSAKSFWQHRRFGNNAPPPAGTLPSNGLNLDKATTALPGEEYKTDPGALQLATV